MPIITDLLRAGRLDLALPFYEHALPMLEETVSFAYRHLGLWIQEGEAQP